MCGKRAIALSFAFFSRNHDPAVIKSASLISVKLIEYLHKNWTEGVDLYSINVPLLEGVNGPETKVLYTDMLQNYWDSGSSFVEIDSEEVLSPTEAEAEIREGDHGEQNGKRVAKYAHKKFKWAPKLDGAFRSVDRVRIVHAMGQSQDADKPQSEPGNDGWAVKHGHVRYVTLVPPFSDRGLTDCCSITPLKANFMHHSGDLIGQEINLYESQ